MVISLFSVDFGCNIISIKWFYGAHNMETSEIPFLFIHVIKDKHDLIKVLDQK